MDAARLPPHKWRLSVLIPVTEKELEQMGRGTQRVFKVRVPPAVGEEQQITGFGIICERCNKAAQVMSPQERKVCRGEDVERGGA